MLKAGIITHYYNSTNYGGNLQAYALCEYINKHGVVAAQISYDAKQKAQGNQSFVRRAKSLIRKLIKKIKKLPVTLKTLSIKANLTKREKAVLEFNRAIPHTQVYNSSTISSLADKFDVFITGSDQVWHPFAVCGAYLLDFVDSDQAYKMSYAASISAPELSEQLLKKYQASLADYSAVSVRENQAVQLLQPFINQKIYRVLDPTLLLDKSDWENIATTQVLKEPYVFCYFLGDSEEHRSLAERFSKKHNLKICTLPHLNNEFRKCDKAFGDVKLYDVSPNDFISLIANAEYIITDSFHAVVFSLVFEKQFFAFDRIIKQSLGSRIYDLTELFDITDRFCNSAEKLCLDYIDALEDIDYSKPFEKYELIKSESEKYLSDNLSKIKEMKNCEA